MSFASADDLRKSLRGAVATGVMLQSPMPLMRHENIDTTMRFYVGRTAQTAADQLWTGYGTAKNRAGNRAGNKSPESCEIQPENAA